MTPSSATGRAEPARTSRRALLAAAHTLAACALLLLTACGVQPTAPERSEERNPTASALQSPGEFSLCRKGAFVGVWIKDSGFEDRGRIEAAWLGARGDTLGLLHGAFGRDLEDDTYRWRATVSGVHLTVVLFELEGTFTFTDPRLCPLCGTGQGEMRGTWRDARSGQKGRLSGEWGDIFLPFEERIMPLAGRWIGACRPQGNTEIEIRERPD